MKEISNQQILDASGNYAKTAAFEGALFERPVTRLPAPRFEDAKLLLDPEAPGRILELRRPQVLANTEQFKLLAGLRVVVAVRGEGGKGVYLPGVVVTDKGVARIGCLTANIDILAERRDAQRLLTDHQQLLLGKLLAQHQPGAGRHGADHKVNSGEVNHGSMAAALLNPGGIHAETHTLLDSGMFSAQLAITGATAVKIGGRERENYERLLDMSDVAGLIVAADHQVPWPFDGDPFDLGAGFTYAARLTQERKPDLAKNIGSLAE